MPEKIILEIGGKDFVKATIEHVERSVKYHNINYVCSNSLSDIKEFLIVICIKKKLPGENSCKFIANTLSNCNEGLLDLYVHLINEEPLIAKNFMDIIVILQGLVEKHTKIKTPNLSVLYS